MVNETKKELETCLKDIEKVNKLIQEENLEISKQAQELNFLKNQSTEKSKQVEIIEQKLRDLEKSKNENNKKLEKIPDILNALINE